MTSVWQELPLFPPSASTTSGDVDALYFALVGVSAFFATLIAGLLLFFAVRYRRRAGRERASHVGTGPVTRTEGMLALEIAWTAIPLAIAMVLFWWGAQLYLVQSKSPAVALDVLVTAKQWMWKLQHPQGQREINELHVPIGAKVRLTMTSEDVIHSFYVPAFRMKRDVLPGRYSEAWFEATRIGDYHLFCAEYCGTQHSGMIGKVRVLAPADYEAWLARTVAGDPPAVAGRKLFESLRCDSCHGEVATPRGPPLRGLLGRTVRLRDGTTVLADESYLREAIVRPMTHVTEGFEPLMPSYEGQVTEEQLSALVAYVQSLRGTP